MTLLLLQHTLNIKELRPLGELRQLSNIFYKMTLFDHAVKVNYEKKI